MPPLSFADVLYRQFMNYIFLNFNIWIYTETAVQQEVMNVLYTHATKFPKVLLFFSSLYLLSLSLCLSLFLGFAHCHSSSARIRRSVCNASSTSSATTIGSLRTQTRSQPPLSTIP